MPGRPAVGRKFHQELAPGKAMDRCEIVSLSGELKVPAGDFKDVRCAQESSAIERGLEKKWYAPGVGLLKEGSFVLVKVEKPCPEPAGPSVGFDRRSGPEEPRPAAGPLPRSTWLIAPLRGQVRVKNRLAEDAGKYGDCRIAVFSTSRHKSL